MRETSFGPVRTYCWQVRVILSAISSKLLSGFTNQTQHGGLHQFYKGFHCCCTYICHYFVIVPDRMHSHLTALSEILNRTAGKILLCTIFLLMWGLHTCVLLFGLWNSLVRRQSMEYQLCETVSKILFCSLRQGACGAEKISALLTLCTVYLVHKTRKHMTVLETEVIIRPKHIGGDHRREVTAILHTVRSATNAGM